MLFICEIGTDMRAIPPGRSPIAVSNGCFGVEPPRFGVGGKLRNRRISPFAVRSGEGPLTEPTAAAQVREREPLLPPSRH
jgi:hypothetical protein